MSHKRKQKHTKCNTVLEFLVKCHFANHPQRIKKTVFHIFETVHKVSFSHIIHVHGPTVRWHCSAYYNELLILCKIGKNGNKKIQLVNTLFENTLLKFSYIYDVDIL